MPLEALGLAASQHAQSVFSLGYAFVGKHKNKEKPQYVYFCFCRAHQMCTACSRDHFMTAH